MATAVDLQNRATSAIVIWDKDWWNSIFLASLKFCQIAEDVLYLLKILHEFGVHQS